jgi:glycosyltransferase involved in cell wall biosynthesis
MISVCMITYDHGDFIAEAIEGVILQVSNEPFELVIGEDFSTDDTNKNIQTLLGSFQVSETGG